VQCLKCAASVHSTKATWQTSFGLTQRHSSIFSVVNDSPHREALLSGRFFKGHWTVCRTRSVGVSSCESAARSRSSLSRRNELLVLVNAYQQRIEAACAGNVATDGTDGGFDGAVAWSPFRSLGNRTISKEYARELARTHQDNRAFDCHCRQGGQTSAAGSLGSSDACSGPQPRFRLWAMLRFGSIACVWKLGYARITPIWHDSENDRITC
jgi:hypothetical protein